MKNLLTILLLCFLTISNAQDVIIYKDGSEKKVKVLKINPDEIVFKKYNALNGPEYTESKSTIFMIKYEGGDKDVFNETTKSDDKESYEYSEIPEGTLVPLYTARELTSKDLQVGSLIELRVKNPVVDENNYILITANTIVYATVNQISKAKIAGRSGSLNLMITDIKDVYGKNIPAYLNMGAEGQDKQGAAWGVGLLLFWPAIFIKGKEAKISAGTLINAVISETRKVQINPELKSSINNMIDINQNSLKLENDCGEKPTAPPTYNNPQYKQTSKYKQYQKELNIWLECTGN
jgi:hypothetical protein